MKEKIKDILQKGKHENASEGERQEMLALFHKAEKEFKLKNTLLKEIESLEQTEIQLPDFKKLFARLWFKIEQKNIHPKPITRILNIFIKIAAALIIGLFIGIYINSIKSGTKPVYYSTYSPGGSVSEMLLPDGSVTFLNADSRIKYNIKGKKGVEHSISLKSKKLAKLVQQCKDIPGKELFQYYDEEGKRHSIDSGMVNQYVKELSGQDFTCKDFRTWSGTVQALLAFIEIGGFTTETEAKKNTVAVLDIVSQHLGNTRTVCRKYYVHPGLLNMYENNKLEPWIAKLEECSNSKDPGLCTEEEVLMKILDSLN